jgi:hypothetical protein
MAVCSEKKATGVRAMMTTAQRGRRKMTEKAAC